MYFYVPVYYTLKLELYICQQYYESLKSTFQMCVSVNF